MKKRSYIISCFVMLVVFSASGQSVDSYLQIAAENNPKVKAAYASFEAAMQKAPQVKSLPDPTLTMSAFGRMVETRVGTQEARFSLVQMFPWFGTLQAREDVANLMAEAAFQNYLDVRNEVFMEVKNMYAELYEVQASVSVEQENLELLDTYKELALSKFRNGKGAMVDVIRIDMKREQRKTNIQLLQDRLEPLKIGFNSILSRDIYATVEIPDTLEISKERPALPFDSLFVDNPKLKSLEKQDEAVQAERKVALKSGYPNIGVGLDYSIISRRDVDNLAKNGQDVIMPMVSVTLPIFRKKYNAAVREAEFRKEAIDYQKAATLNSLITQLKIAEYDLLKANQLSALYHKQIISTEQAIKLLIPAFSNTNATFDEVLTVNQDLLGYKNALISEAKKAFVAQAKIDYYISKAHDDESTN